MAGNWPIEKVHQLGIAHDLWENWVETYLERSWESSGCGLPRHLKDVYSVICVKGLIDSSSNLVATWRLDLARVLYLNSPWAWFFFFLPWWLYCVTSCNWTSPSCINLYGVGVFGITVAHLELIHSSRTSFQSWHTCKYTWNSRRLELMEMTWIQYHKPSETFFQALLKVCTIQYHLVHLNTTPGL